MDSDRVLSELAPAVRDWYAAEPGLLDDKVGRAVAVRVGRRLLASQGESGWNGTRHALMLSSASPAVAWCAAALGCDGKRWTRKTVALVLAEFFGLFDGWRNLWDRLPRV